MGYIIDSYSEINSDTEFNLTNSGEACGQTFTGNGKKLGSCKFYIYAGSEAGAIYVTAKIYAHTGEWGVSGVPTGDVLAISNTVDVSTWGIEFSFITLTFSGINQIVLEDGNHYCIVLELSGDFEDAIIRVSVDGTSPTHEGNSIYYTDSTWYYNADFDVCFYVYGERVGPFPTHFRT